MPALTQKEQTDFLEEDGILMRIGVVREDGSPLVTPIWFIYKENCILFTPRAKSEWFSCLKRDSRVSICIDEQTLPYRKVIIEGSAELLHDLGNDDTWRELYLNIAKRYGPEEMAEAYVENTIDQERALYSVKLEESKVKTWRMPVTGEAPEGIWHDRYYAPGTKFSKS